MFLWTRRRQFWQLREKRMDRMPKISSSISENDEKNSQKKWLPSKCSHGHVECMFDNPKKKFAAKVRENSSQCPKMFKILNIFKIEVFSGKCSYGHVECSFQNCGENLWSKHRKFSAQCPKMLKKWNNFQKNVFH